MSARQHNPEPGLATGQTCQDQKPAPAALAGRNIARYGGSGPENDVAARRLAAGY